jgi:hypothetical protein
MALGDVSNIMLPVFAAIVAAAIAFIVNRWNAQRVRDYLDARGATDVEVARVWLAGGVGHAVYEVEYTDREGQNRGTRCLISSNLLGSDIYWSDPP